MDYGYGWVEILGFFSGALGLSVSIPQLVKILKASSHVGVSIITWVLMMFNYSSWLAFSLKVDSPSQLITNVLAVLATSVLVFVLLKEHWGSSVWSAVFIVMLVGVSIILILTLPEFWMNALLMVAIVARVPQLASSFKSWRVGRHTNVSLLTYVLLSVSSLGWVGYGLVTGLYMNVVSSSIGLSMSVLILMFELLAEKKYAKFQS